MTHAKCRERRERMWAYATRGHTTAEVAAAFGVGIQTARDAVRDVARPARRGDALLLIVAALMTTADDMGAIARRLGVPPRLVARTLARATAAGIGFPHREQEGRAAA